MAITAKGNRFCKVTHTENGRTTTRRIHTMMVQAKNGHVFKLEGKELPDSISLYCGVPYSGAHMAEVLLNPRTALWSLPPSFLNHRDIFFLFMGLFGYQLIGLLAEAVFLGMAN